MITSDWPSVDCYATLGVSRDATADEIADAFRSLAKQLHPDIARDEGEAAERFKEITAAYEVLSDDVRRTDYDRIHASGIHISANTSASGPPPRSPGSGTIAPRRAGFASWSRRKARAAIAAGTISFVAGAAFSAYIVALNQREADERAARVPVNANVVQGEPSTRAAYSARAGGPLIVAPLPIDPGSAGDALVGGSVVEIAFDAASPTAPVLAVDRARAAASTERSLATIVDTAGGPQLVFAVPGDDAPTVVREPRARRGLPLRDGQQIAIRYAPEDPADIVIDDTDTGRNFAFWFVAVKLLVAGPLLAAFGIVRLRSRDARDAGAAARSGGVAAPAR